VWGTVTGLHVATSLPTPISSDPAGGSDPLAIAQHVAAIATLPAGWIGMDEAGIADSLASALCERLALDLIHVRVCDPRGESAFECSHGRSMSGRDQQAAISATFAPWLDGGASGDTLDDACAGMHPLLLRFGGDAPCGGLIACSTRAGFPTPQEQMLLDVAASVVTTALLHLRSERSLASQRERLGTTLDSIGDAVISIDAAGQVDFLNGVATRLIGREPGDAVGVPVEELLPLFDQASHQAIENPALTALREARQTVPAQPVMMIQADAGERLLDSVATPLRGCDGQVIGAVLVVRDMTDVRRADALHTQTQREANAQRERSHLAFRLAPSVMAFLRGPEHVFELVNHRFHDLTGRRGVLGKPVREALPDLAGQGVFELLDRVYRTGQVQVARDLCLRLQRHPDKPLEQRWLEFVCQPLHATDGSVTGILAHGIDLTDRYRAESAVRERDQRLQLMLGNAVDYGLVITDREGTILEWLGGAEHITGWSADEVIGKPSALLFTEEDRRQGRPQEELREAASSGRATDRRWHARRDGSQFFGDGVVIAMRGDTGELHGFGKLFRDDTQRKRSSDELARVTAESERLRRLYGAALSNTPDLVYVFDLRHRFLYANEALLEMLGRSSEDTIGKTVAELGYPDWTASQLDDDIERVIITGRAVRGEMARGSTIGPRIDEYIFAPVIGDRGEVEAVAGTARDVTGRKRAEERFARVAAASQAINASLSIACIAQSVADQARQIIGTERALVCLDLDGSGVLQAAAFSQAHEDDSRDPFVQSAEISALCAQVCSSDRTRRLSATALRAIRTSSEQAQPAGGPTTGWLAVPLSGHGGRNLGVIQLLDPLQNEFTDEDESMLVQLASVAAIGFENARLYESVRQADQRKDEFLATLAHELRNPLAPMRYAIELMRGSPRRADREQAREMIGRQLAQLVRLVDDLLDVARISTGKLQLRRERVELAQLVRSAVETSQPAITAGGHQLEVELPQEPVYLDADPTRLAQVLLNLLNNAAKYSEPGGTIRLHAVVLGDRVEITVRDTGIGIPASMLCNIFEMFSQVERGTERTQGGLGIGLTLVKRLVEMHGGQVEARSPGPHKGSEFIIRLPLRLRQDGALAIARDDVVEQPPPSRRVLVVDDNRDAATSLAFLLTAIGHDARTAHDGNEALALAESFAPDVVVLDIGMPGLNGYEVARRMREMPALQHLSLIALTGWGQEQDRRRSREAGFDHHLVKPADLGELKRLVAGQAA
jgi:PAS domain S-box-containing protein